MKDRKRVIVRVAMLAAVVLLACYLLFGGGRTWQYEAVQDGVLYRASARTNDEFVAASLSVPLQGVVVAGSDEQIRGEVLSAATNYGYKNRARVMSVAVKPEETPSADQLKGFFEFVGTARRRPVLLVDCDGRLAGMLAAAYRLGVLKMPLSEVKDRAVLKDAPAETVAKVQRFAQQYAEELSRQSVPAQPLGPAIPN